MAETPARNWVIRKNGYFYRANRSGYTAEVSAAGLYTEQEARAEANAEPGRITAHPRSEFATMSTTPTDAELLDWLEKKDGYGLISDDEGRWAVSASGTQNLPDGSGAFDFSGEFFVERDDWRPTIREAIIAAIQAEGS